MSVSIINRRASFNYKLLQSFQAGIMLTGTEVKSIRAGKANMGDAFCYFIKDELFIKNMHISEYKQGSYNNHDPRRIRKLLLTARELKKIQGKAKERGFGVVPVKMYLSERGFVKLEIALAQGKKSYDKRESLKTKDVKRDMDMKSKM